MLKLGFPKPNYRHHLLTAAYRCAFAEHVQIASAVLYEVGLEVGKNFLSDQNRDLFLCITCLNSTGQGIGYTDREGSPL